jgi:hypothetical protein
MLVAKPHLRTCIGCNAVAVKVSAVVEIERTNALATRLKAEHERMLKHDRIMSAIWQTNADQTQAEDAQFAAMALERRVLAGGGKKKTKKKHKKKKTSPQIDHLCAPLPTTIVVHPVDKLEDEPAVKQIVTSVDTAGAAFTAAASLCVPPQSSSSAVGGRTAPCRGQNCEFFGTEASDGYCTSCSRTAKHSVNEKVQATTPAASTNIATDPVQWQLEEARAVKHSARIVAAQEWMAKKEAEDKVIAARWENAKKMKEARELKAQRKRADAAAAMEQQQQQQQQQKEQQQQQQKAHQQQQQRRQQQQQHRTDAVATKQAVQFAKAHARKEKRVADKHRKRMAKEEADSAAWKAASATKKINSANISSFLHASAPAFKPVSHTSKTAVAATVINEAASTSVSPPLVESIEAEMSTMDQAMNAILEEAISTPASPSPIDSIHQSIESEMDRAMSSILEEAISSPTSPMNDEGLGASLTSVTLTEEPPVDDLNVTPINIYMPSKFEVPTVLNNGPNVRRQLHTEPQANFFGDVGLGGGNSFGAAGAGRSKAKRHTGPGTVILPAGTQVQLYDHNTAPADMIITGVVMGYHTHQHGPPSYDVRYDYGHGVGYQLTELANCLVPVPKQITRKEATMRSKQRETGKPLWSTGSDVAVPCADGLHYPAKVVERPYMDYQQSSDGKERVLMRTYNVQLKHNGHVVVVAENLICAPFQGMVSLTGMVDFSLAANGGVIPSTARAIRSHW